MSYKDISAVVVAMNIMYETENQLRAVLKRHGLSMNEWLVLKIVYLEYAVSPSEVAAYLNMQRASVTRYVENLSNLKLLDRRYGTEDRRTVGLIVTPAGKKLCKNIFTSYPKVVSNVSKRLDDEDRKLWLSMMR